MKLLDCLQRSSHHQRGKRHASLPAAKAPSATSFNGSSLTSSEDVVDDASFASHQTNDTECLNIGVATKAWTFDKSKQRETSGQPKISLDTYFTSAAPDLHASFATHDTADTESLHLGVCYKRYTFDKNKSDGMVQKPKPQRQKTCTLGLHRPQSTSQPNLPNTANSCEVLSPIKMKRSLRSEASKIYLWSRVQEAAWSHSAKEVNNDTPVKAKLSTSSHEKRDSSLKMEGELSKTFHEESPRRDMTKIRLSATKSSRPQPTVSRQPNLLQTQASERFLSKHLQKELSLDDVFSQYDKIVDSISSFSTCLSDEDPTRSKQTGNDGMNPTPTETNRTSTLCAPKRPRNRTNFCASTSLLDQYRPSLDEQNSFQCKSLQDCLHEYDEITHQVQMNGW